MVKKIVVCLLLFFALAFSCSCADEMEQGALLDEAKEDPSESVIAKANTSRANIVSQIDPREIPYPERASVYRGINRQISEEKLMSTLLEKTEVALEIENNYVKVYSSYTGDLYPDLIRKVFQYDSHTGMTSAQEVFYFNTHIENMSGIEGNNVDWLQQLPTWYSMTEQSYRANYYAYGNCFAPMASPEIMDNDREHIQECLNELGFLEYTYRDGCSYDADVLGTTSEMFWAQQIDGIPVSTTPIYGKNTMFPGFCIVNSFLNMDVGNFAFRDTTLLTQVSDGEIKGWAQSSGIVPAEPLAAQPVVSPQTALETVQNQLLDSFPGLSFTLENIELMYNVIVYKDQAWYVPFWNVMVSTKEGREAANALPGDRGFWYHNQINAFTGEYFLGWDYGEVNDQNVSE